MPRLARKAAPVPGDSALRAAGPTALFDAVDALSAAGQDRPARYVKGGGTAEPLPGFW